MGAIPAGWPGCSVVRAAKSRLGLVLAAVVVVAGLAGGSGQAWAQSENSHGKPGVGDKPKAKAKLLERYRAKLEVKDDAEWNIIQARIENVLQAERELQSALMLAHQNHSFTNKGSAGTKARGHDDPVRSAESDAEADVRALQKLVESRAPAQEIKPRLARVRDMLRGKQEKLAAAREDLRMVLSSRQEAIAVLTGLLR